MTDLTTLARLLSSQAERDAAPCVPPPEAQQYKHLDRNTSVALLRNGEFVTLYRCDMPVHRRTDGGFSDIETEDRIFNGHLPDGRHLVRALEKYAPRGTRATLKNYYCPAWDCIWSGDLPALLSEAAQAQTRIAELQAKLARAREHIANTANHLGRHFDPAEEEMIAARRGIWNDLRAALKDTQP